MFGHDSKISCHVHKNNHKTDFGSVSIVKHEVNFHEQLFLEARLSVKDPQSWNDHIVTPEIYKSQAWAQVLWYVFKNFMQNFLRHAAVLITHRNGIFQLMKA